MNDSTTTLYNVDEFEERLIRETLKDVYNALEERGYNPIYQLIGYIMSGDPGYISSHKEARNKITLFDRTKILEILVEDFLTKK